MILPEGKIDVLLGQSTTIPHSCHIMGFPLRNRNVRQISSDKLHSVLTKHGPVV